MKESFKKIGEKVNKAVKIGAIVGAGVMAGNQEAKGQNVSKNINSKTIEHNISSEQQGAVVENAISFEEASRGLEYRIDNIQNEIEELKLMKTGKFNNLEILKKAKSILNEIDGNFGRSEQIKGFINQVDEIYQNISLAVANSVESEPELQDAFAFTRPNCEAEVVLGEKSRRFQENGVTTLEKFEGLKYRIEKINYIYENHKYNNNKEDRANLLKEIHDVDASIDGNFGDSKMTDELKKLIIDSWIHISLGLARIMNNLEELNDIKTYFYPPWGSHLISLAEKAISDHEASEKQIARFQEKLKNCQSVEEAQDVIYGEAHVKPLDFSVSLKIKKMLSDRIIEIEQSAKQKQ